MAQQPRDNRGFVALLSVLIVAAISVSIAIALLLMGLGSWQTSNAVSRMAAARAMADSCAEAALEKVRSTPDFAGTGALASGADTCTYAVTGGTQNKTVTATGQSGTIVRKVKVLIAAAAPKVFVSSWQEVGDF